MSISKILTRASAGAALGITTYLLLKGDKKSAKNKKALETKKPLFI